MVLSGILSNLTDRDIDTSHHLYRCVPAAKTHHTFKAVVERIATATQTLHASRAQNEHPKDRDVFHISIKFNNQ